MPDRTGASQLSSDDAVRSLLERRDVLRRDAQQQRRVAADHRDEAAELGVEAAETLRPASEPGGTHGPGA